MQPFGSVAACTGEPGLAPKSRPRFQALSPEAVQPRRPSSCIVVPRRKVEEVSVAAVSPGRNLRQSTEQRWVEALPIPSRGRAGLTNTRRVRWARQLPGLMAWAGRCPARPASHLFSVTSGRRSIRGTPPRLWLAATVLARSPVWSHLAPVLWPCPRDRKKVACRRQRQHGFSMHLLSPPLPTGTCHVLFPFVTAPERSQVGELMFLPCGPRYDEMQLFSLAAARFSVVRPRPSFLVLAQTFPPATDRRRRQRAVLVGCASCHRSTVQVAVR